MAIRKINKLTAPVIRVEVIGYSASGKTSLYTGIKALLDARTQSGVFLQTVGDPGEFIRQRELAKQRLKDASREGMGTTVGAEANECFKFCGKYQRELIFNAELRECMGQAIEKPTAHPDEYEAFVSRIPNADVLWIVLPLSQIEDNDQFKEICQTCHRYLEHALEIRQEQGVVQSPVIAIVGTKMDTLGRTTGKVNDRLETFGLNTFFEIPQTIRDFAAPESAIFATSFFGCGKAVPIPGQTDEYKLIDGASKPLLENIDSLLYWTLAAHLRTVTAPKRREGPNISDIQNKLSSDLRGSEPIALGVTGTLIEIQDEQ